ncbi:MAG: AsmA family protein [Planctomycetaceae bacterium]|nr:AsmA family protein [Planctomycetaceae bacterium]
MAKGLKKIVTVAAAIVLVLIIAVLVFVNVYGDRAIKAGVQIAGEKALKVPVRVEDLSLAILAGKLNMEGLVVNNPEGYQHPTFLEAGHTYVALNTKTLLSDTIEIDQIKLEGIQVVLEQKGLTNNLKELLSNLPKSDTPPTETEKTKKNVVVKDLEVKDVHVKISLLPAMQRATTLSLDLAPIHMTNLGENGKMDTAILVKEVITAIAVGIAEQGKGLIPTDMLDSFSGELQTLLKGGQETLKNLGEAGKGLLDSGKNIGQEATGLLKGLVPKKKEE